MAKKQKTTSSVLRTTKESLISVADTVGTTLSEAAKTGKGALKSLQESFSSSEYDSLPKLLEGNLKDLYSAEYQLTKALPDMAKKASAPSLKKAFTQHLQQTKTHITRLEASAKVLNVSLKGKTCKAMAGLIEEGKEVLKAKGDAVLIDAGLIGAAQRVEHYEISAYGTARAMAERLGLSKVVKLLQTTLNEESATDEKLTRIATVDVLKKVKMEKKVSRK